MKSVKQAMLKALDEAKKSLDPKTKVGSVLTDTSGRWLGLGFNQLPPNISIGVLESDEKHKHIIHAEVIAIISALSKREDLTNSVLYSTHCPCKECIKLLAYVGVTKIIFKNAKFYTKESEEICISSGITLERIKEDL